MNILVTGATGFIGKHLVNKFLELGYTVYISLLPKENSPFRIEVKTHVFKYEYIKNDIQYLKSNHINGVIHLASLYITTHQSDQATKLIDSNVKFGTHILEAAVQANIEWFINTGTFWQHFNNAVYSPVNLYAASKQAFESISQYYIETNQIKFCTIYLSDTYGPDDSRPKVFNHWAKMANQKESIDMSPGDQIIDISYIDDIIDAFVLLTHHLLNPGFNIINGSVYAVKAEKRYTLKELATIFEQAIKQKLKINWGGRTYRDREVMIPWENGVVVPGWRSKTRIEEGINKILSSFKNN